MRVEEDSSSSSPGSVYLYPTAILLRRIILLSRSSSMYISSPLLWLVPVSSYIPRLLYRGLRPNDTVATHCVFSSYDRISHCLVLLTRTGIVLLERLFGFPMSLLVRSKRGHLSLDYRLSFALSVFIHSLPARSVLPLSGPYLLYRRGTSDSSYYCIHRLFVLPAIYLLTVQLLVPTTGTGTS